MPTFFVRPIVTVWATLLAGAEAIVGRYEDSAKDHQADAEGLSDDEKRAQTAVADG